MIWHSYKLKTKFCAFVLLNEKWCQFYNFQLHFKAMKIWVASTHLIHSTYRPPSFNFDKRKVIFPAHLTSLNLNKTDHTTCRVRQKTFSLLRKEIQTKFRCMGSFVSDMRFWCSKLGLRYGPILEGSSKQYLNFYNCTLWTELRHYLCYKLRVFCKIICVFTIAS